MMNNAEPPANNKVRILIADSDGAMMDAVESAIGRDVAIFDRAFDGRTAIEKAERYRPDLMVIDANLPRMSGFMILQKLRKVNGRRPFVIMMGEGCGKRHEAYATVSLGAEAFYHKPVRMRKLVDKAHELLAAADAEMDVEPTE